MLMLNIIQAENTSVNILPTHGRVAARLQVASLLEGDKVWFQLFRGKRKHYDRLITLLTKLKASNQLFKSYKTMLLFFYDIPKQTKLSTNFREQMLLNFMVKHSFSWSSLTFLWSKLISWSHNFMVKTFLVTLPPLQHWWSVFIP